MSHVPSTQCSGSMRCRGSGHGARCNHRLPTHTRGVDGKPALIIGQSCPKCEHWNYQRGE